MGVDIPGAPSLSRDPLVLFVGSIFNRRHVPVLVRGLRARRQGHPRPAARTGRQQPYASATGPRRSGAARPAVADRVGVHDCRPRRRPDAPVSARFRVRVPFRVRRLRPDADRGAGARVPCPSCSTRRSHAKSTATPRFAWHRRTRRWSPTRCSRPLDDPGRCATSRPRRRAGRAGEIRLDRSRPPRTLAALEKAARAVTRARDHHRVVQRQRRPGQRVAVVVATAPPVTTHEVVVVDNASTDGARRWCASDFPRSASSTPAATSASRARTTSAFARRTSELVLLLNPDTIVPRRRHRSAGRAAGRRGPMPPSSARASWTGRESRSCRSAPR